MKSENGSVSIGERERQADRPDRQTGGEKLSINNKGFLQCIKELLSGGH